MKPPSHLRSILWHSMIGMLCLTIYATSSDAAPTAQQLAEQLAELVEDGDSVTRVRMKIEALAGGEAQVMQVQIKARRSQGTAQVVYQMFWPKERLGESFLIAQKDGKGIDGYSYTPSGSLTVLNPSQLQAAAFGSDLSYRDVVENFFRWQTQDLAGQETVDRVECTILDSKPGSSDSTSYGRVRSWIDTRKMITMRVEKYDTSDKLVRRFSTTRVAKDDAGHYVPATLIVEHTGSATRTEVEGSNVRHDVTLNDRNFTTEAIADYTVPAR